ncbi:hypothetical protein PC110_g19167 [Phytophthora cactorum]|uniref:Uncharacterized protein n=1 Tax=Phytophthora cactorum TaxID=29920 RepID=A0A329RL46_9STRA|nr:hypothetical protein PC110_g19167 [Phytophthora cactorum]
MVEETNQCIGLIPEDDPDSCGEPGEEDKEDIGDENPARSICASTNFCSWLQCFSSNLFSFDDVDVAAGIPLQSNSDIQQGLALQEWHRCVCCFLCEDRILFEIQFDPARGQESTCSVVDGEETFRTRQGLDLSVVDQKVVGEDAAAMFAIKSGL